MRFKKFLKITNKNSKKKKFRAFSLIELSIVLVVLGLLTTGAFQGSALISKARLFSARSKTRNSPVATIPDLTFWVEATSENSFSKPQPNDGEAITLWKDINPQSDYPLDLDNIYGSGQVRYLEDGINKVPALNFVSSLVFSKQNVAGSQITAIDQISFFIVQKYSSGNTNAFAWYLSSSTGSSRINVHTPWSSGLYFDFGACCTQPFNRTAIIISREKFIDTPKILSFVKNPTSAKISENGQLVVFNNSAAASIPIETVGSIRVNFGGNLGEIIVFARALTDEEQKAVEAYLSQKWKIALQS